MTTRVPDAVARPVRGIGQGGIGWLVTETIDSWFYNMDDRQYGVSVIIAGAVISYIQNLIENRTGKALLREVPAASPPLVDA